MSRLDRFAALAFMLIAAGLCAEDQPWVRVVVPVYTPEPIPGINGSSWATDLWALNGGNEVAQVDYILWDCLLPECGNLPAPLDPGRTFHPSVVDEGSLHGLVLYVAPQAAEQVAFALRFRDLSRQSSTAGTDLPVPRETQFRTSHFSLIGVPVEEGFRQTLRIYEIDGTERDAVVRVRIYALDPTRTQPAGDADTLLGEAVIPLQFTPLFGAKPYHPGYAEVTDFSALAPLGDARSIRVEIEPVTEGLKLWAFVTVIHNDSQHATVITPQ